MTKSFYFFVHLSCSLNDEVIDDLIVEGFYIPNIGRLYIPVMEDFIHTNRGRLLHTSRGRHYIPVMVDITFQKIGRHLVVESAYD